MARLSLDRTAWLRGARNAAIVLAVFLAVVGIVGFFIAPGIVRSVAERQIGEQLGRKATIGNVRLNPYLLAATIEDFKLYEPDGDTVAIAVERLQADVSSASLFKRALVFDELTVTAPVIRVARLSAQRFSFSDIVDRLAQKPKSESPFLFSVNNIQLDGGVVDIDDRVSGRKHHVDGIRVALPFLSNLPYDTTIFVTPEFAARVDGSAIGLTGKAQPFSTSREAALELAVTDLDLTEYVDLSPARLPFKLASGKLSAKLALRFTAAGKDPQGRTVPQSTSIAGQMGLRELDLADSTGRSAITAKAIDVDIARLDPFNGDVVIGRVGITEPHVEATRREDGSIDLLDLFRMPAGDAPATANTAAATTAATTAAPTAAPTTTAKTPRPAFEIAAIKVDRGSVRFVDRTLKTATTTQLADLDVEAGSIALRGAAPTTFKLSVKADDATLALEGSVVVEQRALQGTVAVKGFHPARASPWLASTLAARIDDGSIDFSAHYAIDASGPAPTGVVDRIALHVERLRTSLPDEKAALLAAERIALDGGSFDLATRAFSADLLQLVAPVISVKRDAKGRVNLRAALVEAAPVASHVGSTVAVEVKPEAARPFTAVVKALTIERGDFGFEDLAVGAPVRLRAKPFNLKAENVGTAGDALIPFELDTSIDQRGKLAIKGKVASSPLHVDAGIDASQVPIGWMAAYAGDQLNIVVQSADLNTRGTIKVTQTQGQTQGRARGHAQQREQASGVDGAGPLDISYQGSVGIVRMRALDKATSEEFVQWQALDLPKVDFRMPANNAPLAISLGKVALSDFYARIIVNANGRLNLQDVVAPPGTRQSVTTPEAEPTAVPTAVPTTVPTTEAGPPATGSAAAPPAPSIDPASAPASSTATTGATKRQSSRTQATQVTQATQATQATRRPTGASTAPLADAATAPKPLIRVDGVRLVNGRVGITDNFIKPNYSANLTDLDGDISAVASDDAQPATLKLTGRIDGDGSLDVSGGINPFGAALYTDIAAEAKDIELTRLTPYAVKYAGYAIDRGKLSMTIKYHIDHGKLEAQNRLFLDQLTFGQKVDSPTATKLPVLLAVALLKNSRGEIDVNLPISGSLSDPEFSVGGVIVRVLVNLLTRAVTSPFSLIASAFGGGSADELGYVQFKPGVSDMTPQGKAKLETLAKALSERPALKLDIIGRFDPATDPDGIRRDHLLDRLKDLKAKDLSKSGERPNRQDVTIDDAEYAGYLARVYDDTKLPDKPRNLVGIAKTVPVADMERLLLADQKLDDSDPRWLAQARADVVRHYIEDTGRVSPSRVFLVTPKLTAAGIGDKGVPNRVDFALR